ncbi:lactate racemase domain-containing protein [Halovenus sp. HT40]|uniref:lactate racemase domain-containing protein n=1 Tax=Halovenus sp. HT40 TaxID=3126691 RepID=UPI00300EE666
MVDVPLGRETISIELPSCAVTTAVPEGGDEIDVGAQARGEMADPLGRPLAERVTPDDQVAIVVTDVTRATPDDILLDVLLAELDRGGVDREQVTVVIGLGLHRPMTDEEIEAALGEHADLTVNHDPDRTRTVGTVEDCPIEIFEPVAEADLVCSTGMVEPHQYAGFSGGAKTAVIGAGGEAQIRYSHGPEMLARDGVRLGRIDHNPFRAFVDDAGDALGVDFCLNVTHGPAGITGVAAGEPRNVVESLAATAREALSVEISEEYDAVVAGIGAPKDANLYQASRAATYVVLGANNPLRDGGRVVLPARLPEGAGEGRGEQRFYDKLSAAESATALYDDLRSGYEPGTQRAFVLARALREHDVWVTNSGCPDLVEDCLLSASDRVAEAIDPDSDVLVVPDALNTLLV